MIGAKKNGLNPGVGTDPSKSQLVWPARHAVFMALSMLGKSQDLLLDQAIRKSLLISQLNLTSIGGKLM